jgi:ferredoxin-NADP reductase
MSSFEISLRGHEIVAERTMSFYFDKPDGFSYKAGQSVDLTLLNPKESDAAGNTRALSLVSAPFEDHLQVATRLRDSAFKHQLQALPIRTKVKIDGPFGSMTLHNKVDRPAVFLAGGVGVTPFLSMLRQAAKDQTAQQLYFFYSNRRPEDALFLAELRRLEQINSHFSLIPTMTAMTKSQQPWAGATGLINQAMLTANIPDLTSPIYYLAGPPVMVAAMRELLNGSGIDDDDIRSEEFAGY